MVQQMQHLVSSRSVGKKHPVDERGRRDRESEKMDRLAPSGKTATVTQTSPSCNRGQQKSISGHIQTFTWMSYNSRSHWDPLLSANETTVGAGWPNPTSRRRFICPGSASFNELPCWNMIGWFTESCVPTKVADEGMSFSLWHFQHARKAVCNLW